MTESPARQRIASPDLLWLQDSPHNLMNIVGIHTLDRIDAPTLRELWTERVLGLDQGRRYPRFTQRVVEDRGRSYWQRDDAFAVERHIFEVPEEGPWSDQRLKSFLGHLAADPLPRDRPLWQLVIIPELDNGRSAVITRIHHCMGDGMALIPILFSLQDPLEPAAPKRRDDPTGKVAKPRASKATLALKAPLLGPLVMLRKMIARADRSILHGPQPSGEKRVAWSEPIPLTAIKELKNAYGATVNDVLMAAIAGAFRRYVETASGEPVASLRASVPVNIRAAGTTPKMENRFATVLLELPAGIAHGGERVAEVKRRMDALKRSVEPLVMFGAVSVVLKTLPKAASRAVADFFANKCTCVLTNVPGPQEPVAMADRRIHEMMFWVPQRAKIGIGVSILSFAGAVRLGVISDVELLPEPHALVDAFGAELADLEAGRPSP
ncbi:MAG: WS/DGAT domain-containing protein [Acidobacteriota bacterium]